MVRSVFQFGSERMDHSRHNAGQMVHPYFFGGGTTLTPTVLKTTLYVIEAIHVKIKTLKLFEGNRGDYLRP